MNRRLQSAPPISPVHQALDRYGYAVVPAVLDGRWVERLRRAFDQAPVQSGGTQHIELTDETPEVESWRALEHHPVLKAAAEHLLSQPYCLGGLHGRNPLPGFGQQGLHSDCLRSPYDCILITAIWMLDDFTPENGATRVVPESHRIARPLARDFSQPLAKHRDEKIIVEQAGSLLMFTAICGTADAVMTATARAVRFKWDFGAERRRTRRRTSSCIAEPHLTVHDHRMELT